MIPPQNVTPGVSLHRSRPGPRGDPQPIRVPLAIETTFQEVREHLSVETQRQWFDLILRATPALLGLYSLVAL